MSWLSRPAAGGREEHPLVASPGRDIAGVLLGTSCALLAALAVGALQHRWSRRHPGGPAPLAGQPASGTAEPMDRR